MPAGASSYMVGQQQMDANTASDSRANTRSEQLNRQPLRVIKDPYPTYSAVAVDPLRNEIVLQDENLFQILVYDRMTNTPATAMMSEPKRAIGGLLTHIEFNCGLYIDPQSGDIYSINNDMVDRMVVFSREQKGNVPPMRELHTPHRTFGIAVDEENEELYLTVQHPPQVVVYKKTASGEDKPIRVLEGEDTQLEDAHGIALDLRNQLMYVSNHGSRSNRDVPGSGSFEPPSITVYPLKASGNHRPVRIIEGPKTQLNWPAQIYLDQERQELFVANDTGDSILVFRATEHGDVAPIRILKGPKTGLQNPTGVFVDEKNNELVVANMGNHSATVYPRTAHGDMAPLRTIRGAPLGKKAQMIGNPGAVGYDTKREEILVPN
ncbi:MAG TPA: hypothetical protein VNJ09_11475 [Chthonomonadales bacterium]|nr:hypothetical protein [Chthonomonadales bacterium]